MKVKVVKLFGREVLRIEIHEEVTVSDVVQAMLAHREMMHLEEECEECECEEEEEAEVCACCGEALTEDDIIAARFSTMTDGMRLGERLVWDARVDDEEPDEV